MRVAIVLSAVAAVLLSGCAYLRPGEGSLRGIVADGARPELVREGYLFTEGPVPAPDGGMYFTELRTAQRIHRLDASGRITVFREKSNNANGLAYTPAGELIAAEGLGKRISRIAPDGAMTELTAGDGQRPLMGPNDLIADSKGGIYYTDPGPRPIVAGRKAYVYYLPVGTNRSVAVDNTITRPNGLTLTLDGKALIVADTVGDTLFAFDVQSDGTLANKRPFAKLSDIPAGKESGADGIAIDRAGRIYVTAATGVQVFDAGGRYLGNIVLPRKPTNVAFGGPDKSVLYITAQEAVYRLPTRTRGPDRLGK